MIPPGRHGLLVYEYVPDVLERRAPHRNGHLDLIRRWKEEGRVLAAGAVGDPPHGAVIVMRDAEDAEAFAELDPYVRHGVVSAWRVEPWTVV